MKRSLTGASAAVAAALLLAGCSSSTGGDRRVRIRDDATIDDRLALRAAEPRQHRRAAARASPRRSTATSTRACSSSTDDGEVEPLLAEGAEVSDDGLTYTFTLRDGVTFHSGKALTSADVKYSIERGHRRGLAVGPQVAASAVISDIATPDDDDRRGHAVASRRSRSSTT